MRHESMSSRERVICALKGGTPDRIPFAEHDVDAAVLRALFGERGLSDPWYVADELGLDVLTFTILPPLFVEEEVLPDGRRHQTRGKLSSREARGLLDSIEDPTDAKHYERLEWLAKNKGDRALVARTRLGLSAMLMSMDLNGFSMALADDPEFMVLILRRYLRWCEVAAAEMHKRGVDVLWFFDDVAFRSGPLMSPAVFRELLIPPVREVTRHLPLPWIYHSDGDLTQILDDLLSLGMNGLHPIEPESMSLKELKTSIGDKVCLIGNVSVDVLSRGSTADVEAEVRRCLREGGRDGYMITSSNSIPCYARPENVLAMARAIRQQSIT